jgi:hypothetical protein
VEEQWHVEHNVGGSILPLSNFFAMATLDYQNFLFLQTYIIL